VTLLRDRPRTERTPGRRPLTVRRVFGADWREGYLFVGPMVLLMVGLVAFPFIDAIRLSFTARHGSSNVFVGWDDYRRLWGDSFFRTALKNTVVFTAYSEIFKVTLGLMAALLLHHLRRWRGLATGLVLLPWIIPTVVTAVSWRSIFDPLFGSLNYTLNELHLGPLLQKVHLVQQWPAAWLGDPHLAMPAVIMVNVWKGIPFFTINFLAGLKVIDSQLYEAAAVDGATAWRRFLNVTLPGLRYVLLVSTLLSTMWTFNNFDVVWLLTQGGPGSSTAMYTLYAYQQAIEQLQPGLGSAAAIMLLPISAVLIFAAARYLRPGGISGQSRTDRFFDRYGTALLGGLLAVVVGLLVWIDSGLFVRAVAVLAVLIGVGVLLGRGWEFLASLGDRRRSGGLPARVPIWVGMAALLCFVLAPLYWIVVTAFKPDLQITTRTSLLWPSPWTLDQFRNLFSANPFGIWFRNTLIVAGVSTVVAVVLAALAAYALARLRFRGGRSLSGSVLLTYMMPGSLLFIPLYAILSKLHVIDSLWALIIAYPTFTLPFACWFLMGYFRGIPAELEEAAMTDGATRIQAFTRVIVPLVRPALLAIALFTLTNAWNEFLLAFVFITNDGSKTLPLGMQSMIVGDVVPWGQLAAASIIISVPVVVAYGYAQRFLVEGLAAGAVKG
jgi:multiple sugar transport system permease protein